jgi:large subunit ribosomal protein L7e
VVGVLGAPPPPPPHPPTPQSPIPNPQFLYNNFIYYYLFNYFFDNLINLFIKLIFISKMIQDHYVPASVEKKTQRIEEEKKKLVQARAEKKELIKKRREEWKAKGKKYHDELIKEEEHLIDAKREARNNGNFYMAPEAKVAFVIRIKGVNHIRPQAKKILRLLRLRQLNNGVFVKVNKATMNMIKRIEPYVVYGYPNRKTISDLIYKRGFAKINHARIPLSDNIIIENSLNKYGINCIEDLIEEIYRVGPHFKEANSFLWTFKLNNPRGGWSNKNHSFQNGGDWGNREEEINKLIRKMN